MWEFFEESSIAAGMGGAGNCPFRHGNEQSPEGYGSLVLSFPFQYAVVGWLGRSVRIFQDLRAMSMTTNKRIRTVIPHQSMRILSCHVRFFSPRRQADTNCVRPEMKEKRSIGHGVARAIEDLRGVRMSLVPHSNPRERLLQDV
jgi:hypothetical protein